MKRTKTCVLIKKTKQKNPQKTKPANAKDNGLSIASIIQACII